MPKFTSWEYQKEQREQGIEILFEKIMMESFLNLVKGIHIQVQEAQRLKQDETKEAHTKTHHHQNDKDQRQK